MKFFENAENEEVIDIIVFALLPIFAITLLYQTTFVQSEQADLYRIGIFSLAQSILVFIGICLFSLAWATGIISVKNITKGGDSESGALIKNIIKLDENLTEDYLKWFLYALIVQLIFSIIYGGFTGSIFDLEVSWNYNAAIMVINSAIAEEIFFSLFLTAFLLNLFKKSVYIIFALIINIGVFILFHSIVYGSNTEAIIYIIFLRTVYFMVYARTRRLSIPILLHIVNNFAFVSTVLFV